jgi:hypothetical protein
MTTGPIWVDSNSVSAYFLVRDANGAVGSANSRVYMVVTHSNVSYSSVSTSCVTSSGVCTASLTLSSSWFVQSGNVSVSYGFSTTSTKALLAGSSAIILGANPDYVINNNVVLVLPQRSLLPGTSFSVPVYGNTTNKIALFTLSFTVDTGVNILGISYSTTDWQAVVKKNSNQVHDLDPRVYVCQYVCMYVCTRVCKCSRMYICTHVC